MLPCMIINDYHGGGLIISLVVLIDLGKADNSHMIKPSTRLNALIG